MESLPIRFKGSVTLMRGRQQYPLDTLNRVVVSNTDHHTYAVVPIHGGAFDVDFTLRATKPGAKIRDTLKFHFFTGEVPVLVTSGFVPFERLFQPRCTERIGCNVTRNVVVLELEAKQQYTFIPGMFERSALRDSEKAARLFKTMADHLDGAINTRLKIDSRRGGQMFTSISSSHCMHRQKTAHTHYEHDFLPTPEASERFHKSGLTMLSVADTMQFMTKTHGQLFAAEALDRTQFVAQACQQCQRSAHVMPYFPDLNVGLDDEGKVVLTENECFKRPFFEPFVCEKTKAGPVFRDDCEGQAIWIQGLFESFRHLYEAHMHLGTRDRRAAFALPAETLEEYFPPNLFRMTEAQKRHVFDIAMLIGEDACKGAIRCHVTIVTAMTGALGGGGAQGMCGHVCCVFQSWHAVMASGLGMEAAFAKGIYPVDIIGEGTNCIQNEAHATDLHVPTPFGVEVIPMVDIANHIASELLGSLSKDRRIAMHMTQAKSADIDFYRTAFIQGADLLATQEADGAPRYGIDCNDLSDYGSRVTMPVTGKSLDALAFKGASEWLKAHCEARSAEIHTPRAPPEAVREALRHWSPTEYYSGDPALEGRKYTNCVVSEAYEEEKRRAEAFAAKQREAEAYNRTSKIGHMRTWMGMDSVFVSVSVWTDTTQCLKHMVCDTLCHAAAVRLMEKAQKDKVAKASHEATQRHKHKRSGTKRA